MIDAAAMTDASSLPFRIDVVRSTRRRRSVGAQLVGDVLRISIPSWMSAGEQAQWVDKMALRFVRSMSTDRIDLVDRAASLARRYGLPRPSDIRWVHDMTTRWGSCTSTTGTIRISSRVAAFPDWVIDYIIVHELAHLEQANHGPQFWALVERYPRSERAIGYLIAKSSEADDHLPD